MTSTRQNKNTAIEATASQIVFASTLTSRFAGMFFGVVGRNVLQRCIEQCLRGRGFGRGWFNILWKQQHGRWKCIERQGV